MRILHPRHGDGGRGAHPPRARSHRGRDQGGHPRQRLPLHRLQEDHRGHRARGGGPARRGRDRSGARAGASATAWASPPSASTCAPRCWASASIPTTSTRPTFRSRLRGGRALPPPARRVLKIDAERARSMPGVLAVLTAADVPVNAVGHLLYDWDVMIAEGDVTHCVGDAIALVVAEDPAALERAKRAVKVSYEVLEPVRSIEEARRPDAPVLHGPLPGLRQLGHARGQRLPEPPRGPRRRGRGARGRRAQGDAHLQDAVHRARVPRAGVRRGLPVQGRRQGVLVRSGSLRHAQGDRPHAGLGRDAGARGRGDHARGRRLRRQGGRIRAAPGRPRGARHGPSRQMPAHAPGVRQLPSQAPLHGGHVHARLRRGRHLLRPGL